MFQVALSASAQIHQGFINIQEGKLFYQIDGKGPPLVFLHGICLDHRMWENQIQFFSHSYTCINIDLRGFGKSSVPASPYSFHEDINTVLDSLHINSPVTLIALSMGGKAAINFALTYPSRTRALVLADVAVDGYNFKDFNLAPIAGLAKEKGVDSANRLFLNNVVFANARKNKIVFDRLKEIILSYSGWQWLHPNPVKTLSPVAIQQLDRITAPVLVLTGEKDIIDFQAIAEILHQNIKQSVKKEIAGAGHMCNMEKPEVFNHLVYQFLLQQQ